MSGSIELTPGLQELIENVTERAADKAGERMLKDLGFNNLEEAQRVIRTIKGFAGYVDEFGEQAKKRSVGWTISFIGLVVRAAFFGAIITLACKLGWITLPSISIK